jgi:succinate-semialdehyde dehydrogenase / glutarate-semialdehyde dehydrogenase
MTVAPGTPRSAPASAELEARERPIYLAGDWVVTSEPVGVLPAGGGAPLATTFHAGAAECERAIAAAAAAEAPLAALAAYERGEALRSVAAGIGARKDELARQLAAQASRSATRPPRSSAAR